MSNESAPWMETAGTTAAQNGEPRRLQSLAIETTLRCDQACVFCGSRAGKRVTGELSTEEVRALFVQAAAMGARDVELTGGETYLREDWVDLIRAATAAGLTCAMITAGRGLDESKARLAREAGIDRVSVSIDGLAVTHNALRGSPTAFESGLRAIAALRAAGVDVGCNTTLNARNWRELPDLADLLLGQGLYAWQIQLMIPMGRAADAAHLWLAPYECLRWCPPSRAWSSGAPRQGSWSLQGTTSATSAPTSAGFVASGRRNGTRGAAARAWA